MTFLSILIKWKKSQSKSLFRLKHISINLTTKHHPARSKESARFQSANWLSTQWSQFNLRYPNWLPTRVRLKRLMDKPNLRNWHNLNKNTIKNRIRCSCSVTHPETLKSFNQSPNHPQLRQLLQPCLLQRCLKSYLQELQKVPKSWNLRKTIKCN